MTSTSPKSSNGSNALIVHPLFQQIGNVDGDGAGRAVRFAWHAVPALIVFHVGLAGEFGDAQHVERTDVHANRAALVGDALVLVDDNRERWSGCLPKA